MSLANDFTRRDCCRKSQEAPGDEAVGTSEGGSANDFTRRDYRRKSREAPGYKAIGTSERGSVTAHASFFYRFFMFLRLSGRFGLVPFTPDCYKVVIKDWKKEK